MEFKARQVLKEPMAHKARLAHGELRDLMAQKVMKEQLVNRDHKGRETSVSANTTVVSNPALQDVAPMLQLPKRRNTYVSTLHKPTRTLS